ncbi:MAG: ribosomal protein S18-alanine N-acetyltransferase [Alphaproteobacteria bacterium]|nr:ribosomal protein S18-alanine N-acetyltransferase [Alphaproteobacteria bacterium]
MTLQPVGSSQKQYQCLRIGAESFRVIAALYALAFDDPWPEPSVRELLSVPGTWGMVALDSGNAGSDDPNQPVGFILARVIVDEAEILSIGVPPQLRKAGIGHALLAAGLQRAQEIGATQVFLEVGKDNPAAMALYSHIGFRQVGMRKNYYRRSDGALVDALVMQKNI